MYIKRLQLFVQISNIFLRVFFKNSGKQIVRVRSKNSLFECRSRGFMFSLLHARNNGLALRPTCRPKMEPKGPFDSFFLRRSGIPGVCYINGHIIEARHLFKRGARVRRIKARGRSSSCVSRLQ